MNRYPMVSPRFAAGALVTAVSLVFFNMVNSSAVASPEDVVLTINVAQACEDSASPVSFLPSARETSMGVTPEDGGEFFIDLYVMEGQSANCDDIFGHVTFTATGWGTGIFDSYFCDGDGESESVEASAGVYQCGTPGSNVDVIAAEFQVAEDAAADTYVNTISITLVPSS